MLLALLRDTFLQESIVAMQEWILRETSVHVPLKAVSVLQWNRVLSQASEERTCLPWRCTRMASGAHVPRNQGKNSRLRVVCFQQSHLCRRGHSGKYLVQI